MKWCKILFLLLLFLSSCKKQEPKINYVWTGQESIRQDVPACIIWYKQISPSIDTWMPYKSFSQTEAELTREIILQLTAPEIKESNPELNTTDKLSLIFYNGFPEELKVREIFFELKNQTFIGPVGKSVVLAKILLERSQIRPSFYYPYKDLNPIHYRGDFERILKIDESKRRLIEEDN